MCAAASSANTLSLSAIVQGSSISSEARTGRKCSRVQPRHHSRKSPLPLSATRTGNSSGSCVRTRIGIELTPVVCRVVEVAEGGWIRRSADGDSVVRSFGVWQASSAEAVAAVTPHRGKNAAVVVWGVPSAHHQVEVTLGSYEGMRAEALRILDDAGVPTRGAWADIAPTGPADQARRHVIVTVAAAPAMAAAIQPLVDAGIRVCSAVTPAAALAGIARSRPAPSVPDAVEAF